MTSDETARALDAGRFQVEVTGTRITLRRRALGSGGAVRLLHWATAGGMAALTAWVAWLPDDDDSFILATYAAVFVALSAGLFGAMSAAMSTTATVRRALVLAYENDGKPPAKSD